jgi:hypothetical protein
MTDSLKTDTSPLEQDDGGDSSPQRKRQRTEVEETRVQAKTSAAEPEKQVATRFMLQITREDDAVLCFSADINAPSVAKILKIVDQFKEMEASWTYPTASALLGATLATRLSGGLYEEEEDYWIIDTKSMSENRTKKTNVPKFSVDVRDLVTLDDVKDWRVEDLRQRRKGPLTEVYDVFMLDGWC